MLQDHVMQDDSPEADPRDAELNGLKIRQIALARRTAYRARSYALIAAFACIVIVAQLIYLIATQLRGAGLSIYGLAYMLMLPLLGFGAVAFLARAKRYLIEATQTKLTEPPDQPDFSSLSDGSQRWRDLENIE